MQACLSQLVERAQDVCGNGLKLRMHTVYYVLCSDALHAGHRE